MSDRMPQRGLQCMSDRMSKLGITRRQQFDSLTSCGASRCNCAGRATCTSWYDLLTNLFFPPEEPSMVSWAKGCSSVIASCLSTVSKRFSNVEVPVADSKSAICKSSTTCQAVPVKAAMTFKAAIQLGTLFVASCFVRKLRDTFVGFSSIWFRWRTQGGCHSPELVQSFWQPLPTTRCRTRSPHPCRTLRVLNLREALQYAWQFLCVKCLPSTSWQTCHMAFQLKLLELTFHRSGGFELKWTKNAVPSLTFGFLHGCGLRVLLHFVVMVSLIFQYFAKFHC